jgi:hypothetical protein
MKKTIFLIAVLFITVLAATWYSCGDTNPLETCEQDEICTDKYVTACCTNNVCVYKYNGNVYTENQLDDLATELGCSSVKSAGEDDDMSGVINSLKALLDRVRKNNQSLE